MAEQSGACRCRDPPAEGPCCSPQLFTSALLGLLACVLMTGGVFLAFHRWDPLWLLVSGVGVVLVVVGGALHCCAAREQRMRAQGTKGCPTPHQPVPSHGGSLTEQLLPLSNARSVSQLSLNMLPGYFPPVPYGLEQHSAAVGRLAQHQQHPGGRSFLLLPLAGDPAPNLHNLLATVYQLEGSVASEVPASESSVAPPPPQDTPPRAVLKNAEVQTCNAWPGVVITSTAATSCGETSAEGASDPPAVRPTASGTTQTDPGAVDLMNCSAQICDMDPPSTENGAFANIPQTPPPAVVTEPRSLLADIPDSSSNHASGNTPPCTSNEVEAPPTPPDSMIAEDVASVLVDVTELVDPPPATPPTCETPEVAHVHPVDGPDALEAGLRRSESSGSSLSAETDEGEFLDPPPRYEDVAQRGDAVLGAFGLAYGTL